jgi:hypothetical protein
MEGTVTSQWVLQRGRSLCRRHDVLKVEEWSELMATDPEVQVRFLALLCPLSIVSTIEELLERKSSSSGLENREYCHRNTSR